MSGYNYEHFDRFIIEGGDRVFDEFRSMVHAGDRAPGGTLMVLSSGEPARLEDLWRDRGVVLEFGSFT